MRSKYDLRSYLYPEKVDLLINIGNRPVYYRQYTLDKEGIANYLKRLAAIENEEDYENWDDNEIAAMPTDKEGFFVHPCWARLVLRVTVSNEVEVKLNWAQVANNDFISALLSFRLKTKVSVNKDGTFDVGSSYSNVEKSDLEDLALKLEKTSPVE